MIEKWDKNHKKLEEKLRSLKMNYDYNDLVNITFEIIYNSGEEKRYNKLNLDSMTLVDNGDFQGTLLYVIPFDVYKPKVDEYLMTFVEYGSCSGCDTLKSIVYFNEDDFPDEEQLKDLMLLCKDIIPSRDHDTTLPGPDAGDLGAFLNTSLSLQC